VLIDLGVVRDAAEAVAGPPRGWRWFAAFGAAAALLAAGGAEPGRVRRRGGWARVIEAGTGRVRWSDSGSDELERIGSVMVSYGLSEQPPRVRILDAADGHLLAGLGRWEIGWPYDDDGLVVAIRRPGRGCVDSGARPDPGQGANPRRDPRRLRLPHRLDVGCLQPARRNHRDLVPAPQIGPLTVASNGQGLRSMLSTPPAIPAGTLAAGPQPMLSAPGGLLLRPWEASDAAVFLAAYQDPEIRHCTLAIPHLRTRCVDGRRAEGFDRPGASQSRGRSRTARTAATVCLMSSSVITSGGMSIRQWPLPRRNTWCSASSSSVKVPMGQPAGRRRLCVPLPPGCRLAASRGGQRDRVPRTWASG
jgi:hypothetical protein